MHRPAPAQTFYTILIVPALLTPTNRPSAWVTPVMWYTPVQSLPAVPTSLFTMPAIMQVYLLYQFGCTCSNVSTDTNWLYAFGFYVKSDGWIKTNNSRCQFGLCCQHGVKKPTINIVQVYLLFQLVYRSTYYTSLDGHLDLLYQLLYRST